MFVFLLAMLFIKFMLSRRKVCNSNYQGLVVGVATFPICFAGVLLAGALLAGCEKSDPPESGVVEYSRFIWINESEHSITLSVTSSEGDEFLIQNETMAPGERIETEYAPWVSDYIKLVEVTYDDGTYTSFGDDSPFVSPPGFLSYDPSDLYKYTRAENWKTETVRYVDWTYTFDESDYHCALARSLGL